MDRITKFLLRKKVKKISKSFNASGSVSDIKVLGDYVVEVYYAKDYSEYTKINPKSTLTEEEYYTYWNTNRAIEKALISTPVRIFNETKDVKKVLVTINYEDKEFIMSLTRGYIEKIVTDYTIVPSEIIYRDDLVRKIMEINCTIF